MFNLVSNTKDWINKPMGQWRDVPMPKKNALDALGSRALSDGAEFLSPEQHNATAHTALSVTLFRDIPQSSGASICGFSFPLLTASQTQTC